MKLVMTLLARDEADIIDAWLGFHLNAGADFVIATDNRSVDGTTDVLERYAREGHLHLIREAGEDLRQNEWVTRMARVAATEFGADWVINSDADEFWWPRGASLRNVLAAVPPRYGTVSAFLRVFVPRPDGPDQVLRADDGPFLGARADQRSGVALQAHSQGHPPRASPDPGHARKSRTCRQPVRAAPGMVSHRGLSLPAPFARAEPAQGSTPGRCLEAHRQGADRVPRADVRSPRVGHDGRLLRRPGRRRLRRRSKAWTPGDWSSTLRLRDALRQLAAGGAPLEFPTPTLVDEASYAVEAAVLGEADVVRLQRRLDTLEERLSSIELRLPNRIYRKVSAPVKRALGR